MGIAERKERQRQELRRAILDAALELAVQVGWKDFSIRKVVERIEYAPSIVYQHFANKDDLLRELREEGFILLTRALSAVESSNPRECLKLMARRFWDFARENRAYYTVMMELDGITFAEKVPSAASTRLMEHVALVLQAWTTDEGLDASKLTMEWFEYMLFLHGLVAASTVSFIVDAEERIRFLLDLGIEDFLTAWSIRLRP